LLHSLVFFFFSSRRRHTRSTRDWSSDVCSSDLGFGAGEGGFEIGDGARLDLVAPRPRQLDGTHVGAVSPAVGVALRYPHPVGLRSEERRVGKECRSWWAGIGWKDEAYGVMDRCM